MKIVMSFVAVTLSFRQEVCFEMYTLSLESMQRLRQVHRELVRLVGIYVICIPTSSNSVSHGKKNTIYNILPYNPTYIKCRIFVGFGLNTLKK